MQGVGEKDVWEEVCEPDGSTLLFLGALEGSKGEIKEGSFCLSRISAKGSSVCALHLAV